MTPRPSIVVGIDFSPCSEAALHHAVHLSRTWNVELHCVHVIDEQALAGLALLYHQPPQQVTAEARTRAAEKLRVMLRPYPEARKVIPRVMIAHPREGLAKTVEASGAALLVLGFHGREEGQEPGSVAMSCVRHAPSDVLLVRARIADHLRRVVACTGLGAGSEHVIRRAASVVSSNGCLEILHVMTPPWYRLCQTEPEAKDRSADDDVRRAACAEQLRMAALIARRMRPRIKVRTRLLAAPRSAPAIVQHAGEHELDLVVVGNRNRSFLSTLLLGSTATKVLRSAGCSVLVVEPEPRLAAAQEEEPAGVSP